jgi:hypothetical protein
MGLRLLLVAFVLVTAVYSVVVPPFEAPDEIWHFAFIHHLGEGRGLPVSEPRTQALWRQQGVQAPLYYLAAAALTGWIDQDDFPELYRRTNPHAAIGRPDATSNRNFLIHYPQERWPWRGTILALHLSRLLSIGWATVAVWAVYRTLTLLIGRERALPVTAFVAFIPQFVFISATVNNDNALNALAALVLWRLTVLVQRAETAARAWRRWVPWVTTGLLLGMALLAKLSALGLVAVAGMALALAAWQRRSLSLAAGGAVAMAVPAVVVAGWWYLRNWRLYGDPLAWNLWEANILLRIRPADWRTILAELESLEWSFWGLFGWLNVAFPVWVYRGWRWLEMAIAIGWIGAAIRAWRRPSWRVVADARWLPLLWLLLLLISWLRFMRVAPAAQGRYFFPALTALALLLAVALWALPSRLRRPVGWLAAAIPVGLSLLTPPFILVPAYRPPPEARDVAAQAIPLQVDLDGQWRIAGVMAEPAQLYPGAEARVGIVWQALTRPARDYSVFVHLVDEEGVIVAQVDTMPGGGLLPTSQWQPGQKRSEVYRVRIPLTAYTPTRGYWLVGLYEYSSGRRLQPFWVERPASAAGIELMGDALAFGQVTLMPLADDRPNPVNLAFLDNISLVGYRYSHRQLQPGDRFVVELYWQARGPVTHDYTVFVHLLDEHERTFGGEDRPPVPPTHTWQPGAIVTVRHVLTVAPDAPPGLYQVEIGLYTPSDMQRLPLREASGAEGADRLLFRHVRVVPAGAMP